MFIDNSVSAGRPSLDEAGEAIAEGLTLLRASALKLIRLQLAISRNERGAALEAVDGLLVLDRRLREYLAAFPAVGEGSGIASGIDADRSALNSEKLSLSAEILRRHRGGSGAIGATHDSNAVELHEEVLPSPAILGSPAHRRSRRLTFALLLLLLAGLAAAGWALAPSHAAAWFAQVSGIVR